MKFKTMEAGRL